LSPEYTFDGENFGGYSDGVGGKEKIKKIYKIYNHYTWVSDKKIQFILHTSDSTVGYLDNFDFDICRNLFYFKDGIFKICISSFENIYKRVLLVESETYEDISRAIKYINKGFKVKAKVSIELDILKNLIGLPDPTVYIRKRSNMKNVYNLNFEKFDLYATDAVIYKDKSKKDKSKKDKSKKDKSKKDTKFNVKKFFTIECPKNGCYTHDNFCNIYEHEHIVKTENMIRVVSNINTLFPDESFIEKFNFLGQSSVIITLNNNVFDELHDEHEEVDEDEDEDDEHEATELII
jgi:hypothetical protein